MRFLNTSHTPKHAKNSKFFSIFLLFMMVFIANGCKTQNQLPDPLAAGWKGKSVCEVLKETKEFRTLKCTFPPGVGHDRHYHPLHFGYTLAGSKFRITDTTGTREIQVKTGGHFYNEMIQWHEVVNIGDSTAVYLIMEPR